MAASFNATGFAAAFRKVLDAIVEHTPASVGAVIPSLR
jgi:hypothetical protein